MQFSHPLVKVGLFLSGFLAVSSEMTVRNSSEGMATATDDEPNPPVWPESVFIFRDTDDMDLIRASVRKTQDPWDSEKQTFTCDKHFSRERHSLLFAPGTYDGLDMEIGYYVQIAGLGRSPDDVKFVNGGPFVPALNKHLHKGGTSLDTFWRSAENFFVVGNMQWCVSQAAPLRRVHIGGDLYLHDKAAYASGGHLANSKIGGTLRAGGQQQFLVRNVELAGGATGGAWSMVYSGCSGKVPHQAPGNTTAPAVSVIAVPHIRMEKPYIALKNDGTFELRVPRAFHDEVMTVGPQLDGVLDEVHDFSRVRVIKEGANSTGDIQEALDHGKDVVLTPGMYELESTLVVSHPNQVVLGLGLATLVAPRDGSPCIRVTPHTPGVRLAGFMLEASQRKVSSLERTSSLLEWGSEANPDPGVSENPGGLFDIFVRVGGTISDDRTSVFVDCMLRLHSGNIVGDNLWLWRADHGILAPGEEPNYPHISPIFWQSEYNEFRVETGVEFNGDNIHVSGLAVEHANGHQTVWNGEGGSVHFYQCELPYGAGHAYAKSEFRGYKVGPGVKKHDVIAPGIYSNFRNENVFVSTAIEHPEEINVNFHNAFTVKLDNKGGIDTIVNGEGGRASNKGVPVRIGIGSPVTSEC